MFEWLFERTRPDLSPELAAAVHAWRRLPAPRDAESLAAARFVVVDTETTGLDPERAGLLSIGACEVSESVLHLGRVFESYVRPPAVSRADNVLIHQIGHAAQRSAEPLTESLAAWLSYAGKPVCVGFHAGFDAAILARHVRSALGARLSTAWIDVRILLCGLFPSEADRALDLDGWLSRFRIVIAARHSAVADALATAQLLLIALHHAEHRGVMTVRALRNFHDRTLRSLASRSGESAGL
ncbi:MAG: 3'-5' exonuclease [Burkholderiales bacterium]